MWTFASIILPCVLYDKNYEILADYKCYLAVLFNLIGSSNLADYFDYNEDKENRLNTLPIILGKQNSLLFSLLFMILSSIIFMDNEYFDSFLLQNILFEINNLSIIFIILRNMLL
jgi:4-hydroxybenzoate polyprenyltransferase